MGRLSRRLVSFPALVAAWVLLVLFALPALAVSFLVGLIRRSRFVLCRLYLLAFVYTSLERELLVDPCLDLVGNRLLNHFIDRAHPSDSDVRSIAALASNLGPRDGVVIYPEGTRFDRARRERILSRMEAKGSQDLERAGLPGQPGAPELIFGSLVGEW